MLHQQRFGAIYHSKRMGRGDVVERLKLIVVKTIPYRLKRSPASSFVVVSGGRCLERSDATTICIPFMYNSICMASMPKVGIRIGPLVRRPCGCCVTRGAVYLTFFHKLDVNRLMMSFGVAERNSILRDVSRWG